MIYTQFGVRVEIVGKSGDVVLLRGSTINGEAWTAWRHKSLLKADGGIQEIEATIKLLKTSTTP